MSADKTDTEDSAEEIQVLEFQLGPKTYCVDIEYVSEVVGKGQLTTVSDAPDYVEGVMNLHRRTTLIISSKSLLSIDAGGESKRIIIFDPNKFEDEAAIGWLAGEVCQIVRVPMDGVGNPPLEKDDSTEGVIRHDGDLVVRTSPVHTIE